MPKRASRAPASRIFSASAALGILAVLVLLLLTLGGHANLAPAEPQVPGSFEDVNGFEDIRQGKEGSEADTLFDRQLHESGNLAAEQEQWVRAAVVNRAATKKKSTTRRQSTAKKATTTRRNTTSAKKTTAVLKTTAVPKKTSAAVPTTIAIQKTSARPPTTVAKQQVLTTPSPPKTTAEVTKTRTPTTSATLTKTATTTLVKTSTKKTSTSKSKIKTTTVKANLARATALRKSYPIGLKAPTGDPKFKNATKKAAGAFMYHKNTASGIKSIILQAVQGPASSLGKTGAARALDAADYRALLEDPLVRAKALELLKSKISYSPALGRKIRRTIDELQLLSVAPAVAKALASTPLPLTFDLRNQSYPKVSTIKDQGYCGSCVAFSTMAALESTMLVHSQGMLSDNTNGPVGSATPDLSEENAFFCDWSGASCAAGYDIASATASVTTQGVIYEACDPYIGAPPLAGNCSTSCDLGPSGNFSAVVLGNDIAQIKNHIYTYGAVSTSFAVYQDWMDWSIGATCASTVWQGTAQANPIGGHAVAIVGWEEDVNGVGNWIVKNSWSPFWCDGGYFRIAYGVDAFAGVGDSTGYTWSPAASDCAANAMITCGDGTCAGTAANCTVAPTPTCPDGNVQCSNGTCVASIDLCTNNATCPAGQVVCWNGLCAADFETCWNLYPNNTDCTSQNLFTCLDGTCAVDLSVCPATCENYGLITCPNGDCKDNATLCDTCASAGLIKCPDGTCVLTPDQCFDICAPLGKVMCPNLDCEDSLAECSAHNNTCESSDMETCPIDQSCVRDRDQCPSCESVGRVTCPNTEGRICADDVSLCPPKSGDCHENNLVECDQEIGDFHVCAPSKDQCPPVSCGGEKPITCPDGKCAEKQQDCQEHQPTCEDFDWVTCNGGACAPNQAACSSSVNCDSFDLHTCPDGTCAAEDWQCQGGQGGGGGQQGGGGGGGQQGGGGGGQQGGGGGDGEDDEDD